MADQAALRHRKARRCPVDVVRAGGVNGRNIARRAGLGHLAQHRPLPHHQFPAGFGVKGEKGHIGAGILAALHLPHRDQQPVAAQECDKLRLGRIGEPVEGNVDVAVVPPFAAQVEGQSRFAR